MYVCSVLVSFLRLERLHPNVDPIEYKAILTFLLSAVACLSFSTCYHTFGCMSVGPRPPPQALLWLSTTDLYACTAVY